MKTISRDVWLALGLFGLLAAITVAAAVGQGQQSQSIPLDSQSSAPEGAAALRIWLSSLGYNSQAQASTRFNIQANTDLVLMLEPLTAPDDVEWEELDDWVEAGGVLVLAGDSFTALTAFEHYDVDLRFLDALATALTPPSPLLVSPPLTTSAAVNTLAYFRLQRSDYVTLLEVAEGPVLVAWAEGQGRVVLSATAYPFMNLGLKEAGNPALVLNLVSLAPAHSRVYFDEWHHGQRGAASALTGPGAWLRSTPAGHAMLYVAAVIFVALLLGGRGFGRPLPLPRDTTRRAPLEFISALAHLGRRAGHSQAVLGQYRQQLKRQLGRRYRLDPALADEAYVERLARYDPRLDAPALRRLLARLSQTTVSERELVQLAGEAADWTKDYA